MALERLSRDELVARIEALESERRAGVAHSRL
jgi:hypothetical protein